MKQSSNPLQHITFPSQSPNPNPNPNPDPNLTTNPSDLSATLSSLRSLISFSRQILQNSSFLPPKPRNEQLVPCPYNRHHLLPPESLFVHTLRCPSPLHLDPPTYQNTLQSSSILHHHNTRFTLQDSKQELCLSLDDYLTNSGCGAFFYQGCPAAVTLSDIDASGGKRTFTLPGFLSVECANVVCCNEIEIGKKIEVSDEVRFRILVSDLWFIRRELDGWTDWEYVNGYSFNVFCAIFGLKMVKESDLGKWIIINSPRFGIVIDVHLRDHILILVGLCLKAIIREARRFVELVVKRRELERDLKSMRFKCPVLSQALMWLASQLSVLYSQLNAKLFAINIFKQCIVESTSRLLLFPLEKNLTLSSDLKEDQSLHANHSYMMNVEVEKLLESTAEIGAGKMVPETIDGKVIFVSQVAAAVAALHERLLLEEKIRRLRVSQPLTSYQRMAEHAYISSRADEERKKRPKYRPIIDHDGLPKKLSANMETSMNKTREELLAEERDYKRRRMSYRGKKLKRTTLQVMRDIIEEYMEEIKQAGGIGCFVKGDEEGGMSSLKPHAGDLTMDADDRRKRNIDSLEATRAGPNYYRKHSQPDHDVRYSMFEGALPGDNELSRKGLHRHHERHDAEDHSRSMKRHRSDDQSRERNSYQMGREDDLPTKSHGRRRSNSDALEAARDSPNDYRKQAHYEHDSESTEFEDALPRDHDSSRWDSRWQQEKHGEGYYSRIAERRRNADRSDEWNKHQREQEVVKFSRPKLHETKRQSSSRSSYSDYGSFHSASSSYRRNKRDDSHSKSAFQNAYDDRYDPSESLDMYEDDVLNGSSVVRPE